MHRRVFPQDAIKYLNLNLRVACATSQLGAEKRRKKKFRGDHDDFQRIVVKMRLN